MFCFIYSQPFVKFSHAKLCFIDLHILTKTNYLLAELFKYTNRNFSREIVPVKYSGVDDV